MDINTLFNPETIEHIKKGGYLLMFIGMLLEGPFVTLISAFLASLGFFNIFLIAIMGWFGDTIGDIIFFCIGRYGLSFFQTKREINTKKKEDFMSKLNKLLEKNFFLSLVIIKFTPYAPMIALPYLGTNKKIPFLKFAILTVILSAPVPLLASIVGFHLETLIAFINSIPPQYKIYGIILSVILMILLLVAIVFIVKKYKNAVMKKIDAYIEKKSS